MSEVARFSTGVGHYTQLVWADTEELGCGVVHYQVRRTFQSFV